MINSSILWQLFFQMEQFKLRVRWKDPNELKYYGKELAVVGIFFCVKLHGVSYHAVAL